MTHVGILLSSSVPLPPVGARHAVPFFRFAPTPTVNLNSLYATLTKTRGGSLSLDTARLTSRSFVGAQFIAPTSPRLPTLPLPTNGSHPDSEATPTVSLTPLYATLTKTRGVLVES